MNRSRLRALVGALLVVGVAATTLSNPATASGTEARGVAPVRPEVGSCHALTYAEFLAEADPDPSVACDGRHTSRTFVVRDAPAGTDLDDLDQVASFSVEVCTPVWRRAVSPDRSRRLMSAYTGYAVFVPTPQEQADGARWVRCDVVLAGGARALAPLPATVKVPALRRGTIPDREARCYTGGRSLFVTTCSRAHAYRAKAVIAMEGRAYPTKRAFDRAVAPRCTRASDARRWVYLKPSRAEWRSGYRYVHCLDVTRR